MNSEALGNSNFEDIKLLKRGKVRDVYEIDDQLLIVASDRISAFDVVMDDPIPDKGKILTQQVKQRRSTSVRQKNECWQAKAAQ